MIPGSAASNFFRSIFDRGVALLRLELADCLLIFWEGEAAAAAAVAVAALGAAKEAKATVNQNIFTAQTRKGRRVMNLPLEYFKFTIVSREI